MKESPMSINLFTLGNIGQVDLEIIGPMGSQPFIPGEQYVTFIAGNYVIETLGDHTQIFIVEYDNRTIKVTKSPVQPEGVEVTFGVNII